MKRLLITICGRAGSKGFENKNLKNFCGKPLVYYSLSAAELFIKKHPELEIDVALNTDSEDLARLVAAEYPEVVYLPRGAELGGDRVLTTPEYAAYLKIAEWCDNWCAYCAIPYFRGGFRSRPMEELVHEA